MSSDQKYNYVGTNFVIDRNILKGAYKESKISANGVGDIILNHLSNNPDHVTQIDAETEESTTCAEMRENMIRCALWLQKQGVTKEDVVTVCTNNRLDAYIPCFATYLIGAIYNPWYHEDSLKMACHFMKLTKPKVIFVCESAAQNLVDAARLENRDPTFVVFGENPEIESLSDIMAAQEEEEIENFKPDATKNRMDIALIMFSSGSTGLPKGVSLSYGTLLDWVSSYSVLLKNCRVLWYSPLYWISGTLCMIQTLINNGTRILQADFDPEEMCVITEKYKIKAWFISSNMITSLYKSKAYKNYNLESVKMIITGGAKATRETLQELKNGLPHTLLIQGYGMTEVGGASAIQTHNCKEIESVGYILPNFQLKVVDLESGKTLGPNQPGECYMRGPMQMVDYYENPEATESAVDEEGWVHSGDKVYYTEEGEVVIVDRLKEVMKFRGHHVSPSELEEVILEHPDVVEAAVVPIPHDVDIEQPMAFVKKVPGSEVTEEELVEMTLELGKFKKLWGGVTFLEELPHTASGKINRKELKDMAKALFVLRRWSSNKLKF